MTDERDPNAGLNSQQAPFPQELADAVATATYRPGWTLQLVYVDRGQGSEGLTLDVVSKGFDTYNVERGENYRVHHYFPVPPAAYNRQSWLRWLLDCLVLIETHEACEFLVVAGRRPFAPVHAPGFDPYVVREVARVEDAETTFRGERHEGSQA
jgi:hypothetical protein